MVAPCVQEKGLSKGCSLAARRLETHGIERARRSVACCLCETKPWLARVFVPVTDRTMEGPQDLALRLGSALLEVRSVGVGDAALTTAFAALAEQLGARAREVLSGPLRLLALQLRSFPCGGLRISPWVALRTSCRADAAPLDFVQGKAEKASRGLWLRAFAQKKCDLKVAAWRQVGPRPHGIERARQRSALRLRAGDLACARFRACYWTGPWPGLRLTAGSGAQRSLAFVLLKVRAVDVDDAALTTAFAALAAQLEALPLEFLPLAAGRRRCAAPAEAAAGAGAGSAAYAVC